MNHDRKLQLQRYLDGDLSEADARRVRAWVEEDAVAARLLAELTWVRGTLANNEPAATVPESREFYWNRIERAIEREDSARAAESFSQTLARLFQSWRRALAPAAGAVMALALMAGLVRVYDVSTPERDSNYLAQIESPSEDVGVFTFRSQTENVFVIWLYDRQPEAGLNSDLLNSVVFQ